MKGPIPIMFSLFSAIARNSHTRLSKGMCWSALSVVILGFIFSAGHLYFRIFEGIFRGLTRCWIGDYPYELPTLSLMETTLHSNH